MTGIADEYKNIFVYDDGSRIVALYVLSEPTYNERTNTWCVHYAIPTGASTYRRATKRVSGHRLIEIKEVERQ